MMKIFHLAITSFLMLFLIGCSESEEKKVVEKETEKIAQEAVEAIQTPIDQTEKAVKDINLVIENSEAVMDQQGE